MLLTEDVVLHSLQSVKISHWQARNYRGRRGRSHLGKISLHPEKYFGRSLDCMHSHCFRTCYRCKILTPSENSSLP